MREAYDWMREQMARRLPGYSGHYPWWANDYRIDLRLQRCQISLPDTRHVRLELAVPAEKVLFSAYGNWHCVLNRWYLPTADETWEAESDAWDAELKQNCIAPYRQNPLPEPWETRMCRSWERMFDVELWRKSNTIQATFECLELSEVVEATEFPSKGTQWDRAHSGG